jgi:hypothetical protein
MKTLDFQAIKEAVPVLKAAQFLGLELKQYGEQYRCPCPTCQAGGDRCIVITPAKNVWYDFSLKKGGDCIYLVAHIKGIGQREAAEQLFTAFMQEPEKPKRRAKKKAVVGGNELEQWETFISRL